MVVDLPYDVPTDNMFKPIVTAWTNRFEAARKARAPWDSVVNEIMDFYSKSAAAMFDPRYQKKFWPGKVKPRFRVNINLAYEYVRVMLPEQLWETPHRNVERRKMVEIPEGILDDQMMQQIYQEQTQTQGVASISAILQQTWLNYTGREMPGGGLHGQSVLAVLDALLKGRGVKCIRPYTFPDSDRLITGCFRLPPEMLLIDPDCKVFSDAGWISIQHIDPHWKVERRFKLPDNSLAKRASMESSWSNAETRTSYHHQEGETNDLIVWYEVYSKTGLGCRRTGMYDPVKKHLEDSVGDFAYLAICPAVPWPLNAPLDKVLNGASTEEVKRMFAWPIKSQYKDGRWPIELNDFYPNTDHRDKSAAWPIPPLAPALGEIKMLNYLVPFLVNRAWTSSRDFWAVAGPYKEMLQKEIEKAEDQAFIGIPAVVDDIKKVLTIIQQPETRRDMWDLIALVETLFRKRTGMALTAYGMNEDGTQNRSAEETIAKHRAVNSTPEYMQRMVVEWESRCAAAEAAVARTVVRSKNVQGLFGPTLSRIWDQVVGSKDADKIAAQLEYTVAASSIRRPNRDRDIANMQQVMQMWLPIDMQYAGQTGNYSSVNATKKKWGELHDMDVDQLMIPDDSQGKEEEQRQQMEMEKQRMELEMAKLQADAQGGQLDVQGKQIDLQGKQLDVEAKMLEAEIEQVQAQAELNVEAQSSQMTLAQKAQELQFEQAKGQQEMELASGKGMIEIMLGRQKLDQQRLGDTIKASSMLGQAAIKQQLAKSQAKAKK